jgi:hypothetical protein
LQSAKRSSARAVPHVAPARTTHPIAFQTRHHCFITAPCHRIEAGIVVEENYVTPGQTPTTIA